MKKKVTIPQRICYDFGEFHERLIAPLVEQDIVSDAALQELIQMLPFGSSKSMRVNFAELSMEDEYNPTRVTTLLMAAYDEYGLPYEFYLVE